jgi:predicted aldo/keto reductase-like oxidoreductase
MKKKRKDDMSVVALTPDKIHHEISRHISQGVPYIDALVDYAEKNNVEIETIAQIVKKSSILREKIRTEAVNLKMVRKDETDLTDICD